MRKPFRIEGQTRENEPDQMDVTYLAINLAYLPDAKQKTFNMDTSNGKAIFP